MSFKAFGSYPLAGAALDEVSYSDLVGGYIYLGTSVRQHCGGWMFYLRVGVGVQTGVREPDRRLLWVIQA